MLLVLGVTYQLKKKWNRIFQFVPAINIYLAVYAVEVNNCLKFSQMIIELPYSIEL